MLHVHIMSYYYYVYQLKKINMDNKYVKLK